MKRLILKFAECNIAGYSWGSNFYLERKEDGTYSLSCRQGDPVMGLRDGADIYEALDEILSEAGHSLGGQDLCAVADKIAKIDAGVAEQFRNGPELLQQRYAAEAERAASEREELLRPYRQVIDRYVLKISNEPLRYPGGGSYGTKRGWTKRFIEDYVIANGRLPTGGHRIEVKIGGASYSGGTEDFSDLK